MNDYFDDVYYYDYDDIVNPGASECTEDDMLLTYTDEQIWLIVKADFEQYIKTLLEDDLNDSISREEKTFKQNKRTYTQHGKKVRHR